METHHPSPPHKKKWCYYLFDFFMLFLAISLGFYVDNLREHYVENKREKQYETFNRDDRKSTIPDRPDPSAIRP
jgi:hypothetical protein